MVKNTSFTEISILINAALFMGMMCAACKGVKSALPEVRHIQPSAETATSLATVVKDVPLAFTNQLFPFDQDGNLVGASNLTDQVDQVLKNLEAALQSAGTDLGGLVRVHVYLNDGAMYNKVLDRMGKVLSEGVRPAITFISGGPARPGVMVSMDAVAVAPRSAVSERVSLFREEGLFSPDNRSHVAVLAPGRRIFISGQAEVGDDLSDASINTMRNLFATLAYLGASAEDVVQVKAFINPIEDAKAVEEDIASFFRGRSAPPIVFCPFSYTPIISEFWLQQCKGQNFS